MRTKALDDVPVTMNTPMLSDPAPHTLPLRGMGVLVTRPQQQAEPLCRWIESNGGVAIRCPTLSIHEPRDWSTAVATFERLSSYHLAIFTSANAVDYAFPRIRERGGCPPTLEIAAIGKATARTLHHWGIKHCLQPPHDFTSEGLLALPRFQAVAGQSILIVRGEGGRTLLADTLSVRGAQLSHAEVYRRERPLRDINTLLASWAHAKINAVVVTSTDSFLNLFDMLSGAGQDYLRDTPLIVLSDRIRQIAADYGCRRLLLAKEASDAAIAAVLLDLTATYPSVQLGNVI